MAVTINARGTSVSSFEIGKGGSTITADANGYLTIADGVATQQPLGYNTIPIYEIDVADTFDLAHAGMMWHKDSGGAVTFTCDNDSTIPQGSTWIVHNDDAEDITIAEGTGVTIAFLASGAAPATGDVTVEQGGVVTVYKYTDTEYWVWGDDGPFNILTAGATTDSTLRWGGSAWTEETQVTISASGVLTVLDSGLTDSVAFSHDGTDFNIVSTNTTAINVDTDFNLTSTGYLQLPSGTIAQRPGAPVDGMVRFNSEDDALEYYADGQWNASQASTGASLTLPWNFSTTTTSGDPGSKSFRLNNATLASVTEIYVNDTSRSNIDASTIIGFLSTGDQIYIQQGSDATKAALFEVTGAATDNTGWWTIPVSVLQSNTLMDNNQACGFVFIFANTAQVDPGVTTDSALRWNGSAYVPENQVQISSAGALTILDGGLTDSAAFSHDGADFNTTFTNTSNWNISGNVATYFASGSNTQSIFGVGNIGLQGDNSDGILRLFGEQTSVVYGAEWKVEASYGLFQGTTVGGVTAIGTTAYDLDVHIWNGNHLRIYDSTQTDYLQFSHDGTDFNFAGTTTTDINMTSGITAVNMPAITLTTALDETYGGTAQTTYATGDILYASGADTLTKLAAGTNGHVLTLAAGVPSWAAAPGGPTEATVQTTDATQTELYALAIASGTSVGYEALIIGREDSTGDTVLEKIRGLISNEAGTTALIDTPGVDRHEAAGATAWSITVAADDTTDELTFDVTGEAAHTIDWKINITTIVV